MTLYDVSRACGRAHSWAGITSTDGRDPATSTLADIADACGCDLVVMDRESGEIVARIDPPER